MIVRLRFARVPVPQSARARESLAARWLADREMRCLTGRAVEKRRSEFVAGRLAAKAAAARLYAVPMARDAFHTLVATGDAAGQPINVDPRGARRANLSITHSDGWAVAAAATAPVGIDLTPLLPPQPSFDEDAFLDGELAEWQRLLGSRPLSCSRAVAFAAKEAALKWLGVGLRTGLHAIRVAPRSLGTRGPCADLGIQMHALAVTVHTLHHSPPPVGAVWRRSNLEGMVGELGGQAIVALIGERR